MTEDAILSKVMFDRALDQLEYRDRIILQMYFYEDKTLDDICPRFNVTRERIRQLRDRALRRIRERVLNDFNNDGTLSTPEPPQPTLFERYAPLPCDRKKVIIRPSVAEREEQERTNATLRLRALGKLTDEEKRALGF